MYPNRELIALAEAKAALQQRIALRRTECSVLTGRVVRPLAWFERVRRLWRRLAPFAGLAALPAAAMARRAIFPHSRLGRLFLRWSPALLRMVLAWKARHGAGQPAPDSAAAPDAHNHSHEGTFSSDGI